MRGSAVDVYVLPGVGLVPLSGLKSVVVQLQRGGGGYFNGRSFQSTPFNLPTRQLGRGFFAVPQSVMPPLSLTPSGRYRWLAIATDNAGNVASAQQFVVVDQAAPTVLIVEPRAGSDGRAHVSGLDRILAYCALDSVEVTATVQRADGLFFNGRGFQTAKVSLRSISFAPWFNCCP